MRDILRLESTVLPYPWGSRSRIAELLGQTVPAAEPQAELWMGAHPKASSRVVVGGAERRLDELIAAAPAALLGAELLARGPARLPFLLKLLAAERALSIQAHPDLAQAEAGFAREEKAGVPLEADQRNYRDRCHKPEVLFAVEPFWILRGFRAGQEILELAEGLGLAELLPGLVALRQQPQDGLAAFFASTLAPRTPLELERLNAAVVAKVLARGLGEHPVYRWVLRLADQFPADRGVFSPLFLNIVRLEPGQAIFTGPGILHAYLEGFGVELMANSDNVLRGGLTTKHVDVAELLSILRFEAQPPELLRPEIRDGEQRFAPPVADFALTLVPLERGCPRERAGGQVEILFVLGGGGELIEAGGRRQPFRRGEAFLVPAGAGGYRLEGEATLFRAEPGAG